MANAVQQLLRERASVQKNSAKTPFGKKNKKNALTWEKSTGKNKAKKNDRFTELLGHVPSEKDWLLILDVANELKGISINSVEEEVLAKSNLEQHYKNADMKVSKAIIAAGIHAHVSQHLGGNNDFPGGFLSLLGYFAIQRSSLKQGVIIIILFIGSLVSSYYLIMPGSDENKLEQQSELFSKVSLETKKFIFESELKLSDLQLLSDKDHIEPPTLINAEYYNLKNSGVKLLVEVKNALNNIDVTEVINNDSLNKINRSLSNAERNLDKASELLRLASRLVNMKEIMKNDISNLLPEVALRKAEAALSAGNLPAARQQLNVFRSTYVQVTNDQKLMDELKSLNTITENTVAALSMTEAAKKEMDAIYEQIQQAINSNQLITASSLSQIFSGLAKFLSVTTYLELVQVPFERTDIIYSDGYYLLVQASPTDAALVPLWFKDNEGQWFETERIGVEVSSEVYEKFKQTKKDHGVVENDIIAIKPEGNLDFNFLLPVLAGRITNW